jgi:hypothetical protein
MPPARASSGVALPGRSQMPTDAPYADRAPQTAADRRDAGYEIAGQVQQELTKEQLNGRMRERFGATER